MFRKRNDPKKASDSAPSESPHCLLKYARPKILMVDMDDPSFRMLLKEGYNVSNGSFGRPYIVPKGSNYRPVIVKASLPNYTEQEIIIVDLAAGYPSPEPNGEKHKPMEELDWWAKCSDGVIDPRPRAMAMVQNEFNRIFENGGTFVVFADIRDKQEIVHAWSGGRLHIECEIPYDNWSFLPMLSQLHVTADHGEEISPIKDKKASPLVGAVLVKPDGAIETASRGKVEKRPNTN